MGSGPTLAVAAVCMRANAVLLVRRANEPAAGRWSFPGGRVEVGELLEAAVLRELLEETQIEGSIVRRLDVVERIGSQTHHVIVDYLVEVDPAALPVAGSDAADAAWVELGDLAELDTTTGLQAFLVEHGLCE